MSERIPSIGSQESAREFTPQKKLESLAADYEKFSNEPYSQMDPEVVNLLKNNVLKLMDDLKKDYPELLSN